MKIFLSMPILDRPELNSFFSVYQSMLTCPKHQVRIYFNHGDSLVSRARTYAISAFINDFPDYDYFISVDSDLEIINCYPNNNIFEKLIAHDLDFVGGLYAVKKEGVRRCSSITMDLTEPQFDTGLIEMRWLSTGCWCLKRSAIEKMIKAYPELTFNGDDVMANKIAYGLYLPMLYDLKEGDFPGVKPPRKKLLSEDWSWCQRWREIGGKIYADSSLVLNHIGRSSYKLWNVEVVKQDRSLPPPPGFDLEKK